MERVLLQPANSNLQPAKKDFAPFTRPTPTTPIFWKCFWLFKGKNKPKWSSFQKKDDYYFNFLFFLTSHGNLFPYLNEIIIIIGHKFQIFIFIRSNYTFTFTMYFQSDTNHFQMPQINGIFRHMHSMFIGSFGCHSRFLSLVDGKRYLLT